MYKKSLIIITSIVMMFSTLILPVTAGSISIEYPTYPPPIIAFGAMDPGMQSTISSPIYFKGSDSFNLYIRATDFTSTSGGIIPVNNFQGRIIYPEKGIDSGYITFNGSTQRLYSNWSKPAGQGRDEATMYYRLNLPSDTLPGNYTSTVIISAIATYDIQPVNIQSADNSTSIQSQTLNSTNSTNSTNQSQINLLWILIEKSFRHAK